MVVACLEWDTDEVDGAVGMAGAASVT